MEYLFHIAAIHVTWVNRVIRQTASDVNNSSGCEQTIGMILEQWHHFCDSISQMSS